MNTRPANELTLPEIRACEGTRRRWANAQERPVCPVCDADPGWLAVRIPRRYRGVFSGHVPPHPDMIVWAGRIDAEAWRAWHPEYQLTTAQVAALNQVRRTGASALSQHTDATRNTVHAGSARALVCAGLAEPFTSPDGKNWIRVPATALAQATATRTR